MQVLPAIARVSRHEQSWPHLLGSAPGMKALLAALASGT
jgi:hypothetical protein